MKPRKDDELLWWQPQDLDCTRTPKEAADEHSLRILRNSDSDSEDGEGKRRDQKRHLAAVQLAERCPDDWPCSGCI